MQPTRIKQRSHTAIKHHTAFHPLRFSLPYSSQLTFIESTGAQYAYHCRFDLAAEQVTELERIHQLERTISDAPFLKQVFYIGWGCQAEAKSDYHRPAPIHNTDYLPGTSWRATVSVTTTTTEYQARERVTTDNYTDIQLLGTQANDSPNSQRQTIYQEFEQWSATTTSNYQVSHSQHLQRPTTTCPELEQWSATTTSSYQVSLCTVCQVSRAPSV